MSDTTSVLEHIRRQVTSTPDAFERLTRKRDRRRRNKRLGAAIVALVVATASFVALERAFHSGANRPASPSITADNVKDLSVAWQAKLGASGNTGGLVVSGDSVYVATRTRLVRFALDCGSGGARCRPSLIADLGNTPVSKPVVDGRLVYVVARTGPLHLAQLEAFPDSCGSSGSASCQPLWTAGIGAYPDGGFESSASNGMVYVLQGASHGHQPILRAFAATCHAGGEACWSMTGGDVQMPVEADGDLYLVRGDGRLLSALPADCRDHATTCPSTWSWAPPPGKQIFQVDASQGIVFVQASESPELPMWTYVLPGGCATGAACQASWRAPGRFRMATDGVAFIGSRAYAIDCRSDGGTCTPLSKFQGRTLLLELSPDGRTIYASRIKQGVVRAYPTSCIGTLVCPPIWRARDLSDWETDMQPIDGLVFVGSGYSGELVAYRESCGRGGATCKPVWSLDRLIPPFGHGRGFAFTDGAILVTSLNALYAIAPGGRVSDRPADASRGGAADRSGSLAMAVLLLLSAVAARGAFRRHGRRIL